MNLLFKAAKAVLPPGKIEMLPFTQKGEYMSYELGAASMESDVNRNMSMRSISVLDRLQSVIYFHINRILGSFKLTCFMVQVLFGRLIPVKYASRLLLDCGLIFAPGCLRRSEPILSQTCDLRCHCRFHIGHFVIFHGYMYVGDVFANISSVDVIVASYRPFPISFECMSIVLFKEKGTYLYTK